ncbi:MAG: hypothetical protein QXP61_07415, partial [Nitrososphaerales archaeon]
MLLLDQNHGRKFYAILFASILTGSMLAQIPIDTQADNNSNFAKSFASIVDGEWDASENALGAPDGNCATTNSANRKIDLTNFGFSIPNGATITGIKVEIDYARDGNQQSSAQLLKNGLPVGDEKSFRRANSSSPDCSTSEFVSVPETVTDDLWGTAWTPADINNAGFGVRIDSGNAPRARFLDSVSITVFYVTCNEKLSTTEKIDCLIADVQELVDTGVLNKGQGKSLLVKLEGAKTKLEHGKITQSIHNLQGFIKRITSLVNNGVLAKQTGQSLINNAVATIEDLGGTPVFLSSSNGILSSDIEVNLVQGDPVKFVLINNDLPDARLNTIEFEPSSDASNVNFELVVGNQVLNIVPPPNVDVKLYFEINPSVPLSKPEAFNELPLATFEIDKNGISLQNLALLFFDEDVDQWILLGSPTLLDETDDSFILQARLPHFSRFALGEPTGGGGVGSGGSGGGGGPAALSVMESGGSGGRNTHVLSDGRAPSIISSYHKPNMLVEGDDLVLTAQILDDVGVADAKLFYSLGNGNSSEIHSVSMKKISTEWWSGTINASNIKDGGLSYWITATDHSGNMENSEIKYIEVQIVKSKASSKVAPPKSTNGKTELPNNFLELGTIDGRNTVENYSDIIVIRNNSTSPVHSVRLTLSPEIANSFHLDKYSIKSIEPNGNVTVGIKLVGNPNRDMYGKVAAYVGSIIVMAPNHSPVMLPVKIGSLEDLRYHAYMEKIQQMANQRYRISLINTVLNTTVEPSDIDVSVRNGSREVLSVSEDLVVKNTSDRTLSNVRIISKAGNAFLLDRYNIPQMAPNEEISIHMIPRMDAYKYSPRDVKGEIIIAPDNGSPVIIPVNIRGALGQDSIDEYELSIVDSVDLVGNASNEDNEQETISITTDTIQIKNTGKRNMDSVKVTLSENLARIFTMDNDTFRTILPGEEVSAQLMYKAKDLKTFIQNFNGEIRVVSEHHNMRTVPLNIEWSKTDSRHFVIYYRAVDEEAAKDVLDTLEKNYHTVASGFGDVRSKVTLYMTHSVEELKIINPSGYPFYSYNIDAIFICACDEAKENALEKFIYRTMIMKYPMYYNMKKIEYDNGNWLMDGMAKYISINISMNTGDSTNSYDRYIDAFNEKPVSFQWYGTPTDAQLGAAITFFK